MELNENLATIVYSGKIDGDIFSNGDVSISSNSSVWDVSANGTIEVLANAHAKNVTSSKMVLKEVKSEVEHIKSKEVEFYLYVG